MVSDLPVRGGSSFFLGGGANVSCSTSTLINHIVFFCRIPVVLENRRSSQGGGAHPLHPPPGSAPASLPQNCHIRYGLNPKRRQICVAWVWSREGTEKLVNGKHRSPSPGKQHSVWFKLAVMSRLPQNVLLSFRLEFSKIKWPYHLPSIPNFWNFLSNGEHPWSLTVLV